MRESGSQVQNEIYVTGEAPWPIAPEDWEAKARALLDDGPFGYVAGGAGSERTMKANLEAFERVRLAPKLLAGNERRDLSVQLLGTLSPVPFLLAPVGVLSIVHPEGEVGADATVLMDGGIRRGSDVLKALAVGGQDGVAQVIRYLEAELDITLALAGCHSAREFDASFLA